MRNILVTGGAGYIGSHTVVELASEGARPVILDNFSNSEKFIPEKLTKLIGLPVKVYEGDYQDRELLKKIFSVENIDGIIHFAAYKSVEESVQHPLKYFKNNVSGLVDLLESMEENKVADLVFSSSCTVYGEPDKLPVTEEAPFKPAESPYGATKQMCETIIMDSVKASQSLKAISLRYFNPIGGHESGLIGELPLGTPANLVPLVTQAAAGVRKNLTVFGDDYPTPDGTCIRDYIHVVDLAQAHVKALNVLALQKSTYYDTFNIGGGKGNSVLEVIKTFEKCTGQKVPYTIGPRRPGDIISTYADVNKARKILGWVAQKELSEALADAWRWQKTLAK